jgi:hypothetical protein
MTHSSGFSIGTRSGRLYVSGSEVEPTRTVGDGRAAHPETAGTVTAGVAHRSPSRKAEVA